MKIGFIGFGEAAYNISLGLKGEGVTGIIAYDKMAGDPVMGTDGGRPRRGGGGSPS